jgi:hypothetical protein
MFGLAPSSRRKCAISNIASSSFASHSSWVKCSEMELLATGKTTTTVVIGVQLFSLNVALCPNGNLC